jgi:hypothetical protein
MDIERIEIGRCGCLEDVVIERLGPGLHVFHGTNETGKTTLLEFVRGMLFGFGSLVRRGVIDPKLEATGRLLVRPVSDSRPSRESRRQTTSSWSTMRATVIRGHRSPNGPADWTRPLTWP